MKHDVKPNHSQVKPKLISFATELFLCKKWIFLSLGNKLVKRTNESLKFLFVFWRKSLFLKISKLLRRHFLPTWTRLFSNHNGNYVGICRVPPWIKRVDWKGVVFLTSLFHAILWVHQSLTLQLWSKHTTKQLHLSKSWSKFYGKIFNSGIDFLQHKTTT